MAHHDEASTHRRLDAAVGAPEFLEVSEYEVSTQARRVPGYGLAPYTQQSSLSHREELSSFAHRDELAQRETVDDLPRRRTPRATPTDAFAAEPLSSSKSTAKMAPAPFNARAEGSGPKPVPTKAKPIVDVAPPSIYPQPRVISPGKNDREGSAIERRAHKEIKDVAPPSIYPEPKVISPAKAEARRAPAISTSTASQSAPSASAPSQTRAGSPASRREATPQASQPESRSSSESRSSPSRASSASSERSRSTSESRSSEKRAESQSEKASTSEKSRSSSQSKSRSDSKPTPLPAPPAAPAAAPTAPPAAEAMPPNMIDPLQVPVPPEMATTIYSWIRRLALQNDLATADRVVRDALLEMTSSLACSIIYPGQDGLWTLGQDDELPKDTTPIVACAQVRRALLMSHTAMIPIVTTTETVGVIILTRNPRNPAYHPLEQIAALGFIREAAAILHHLAVGHLQKQSEIQADKGSLYRGEALEAHRTRGNEGVLVQLSPGWVRRTYPFLLIAILIAIVFTAFIKVPTYASGQGVMVIDGTPVTSPIPGNVAELRVVANQRVKKNSIILKLNAQAELAELQSAQEEEDAYMATYLFDHTDENNKKQLVAAAQKVEATKKRIEQKVIRAPEDGVVSDIRARIGEALGQGDPIVTILPENAEVTVVTFLNAADRPRLHKGMNMKVNIGGYTKAPETAKIIDVGNDAIAPEAIAKYLNTTLAGTVKLAPGSYVLVKAKMPSRTFRSQNQTLYYHHGMQAKVDVLVNEKPFLVTLIPALEKYLVD